MKSFLKTLSSLQREYLNLNLKNPFNGKYFLCAYHILPKPNKNILQVACEIASESSTGTNFLVNTNTSFSKSLNALVYKLDLKKNIVFIAYPWRIFDRNGNIQNILTYIVGNIFGMKDVRAIKLMDVWFPAEMLKNYDGPSYTLEDLRKYLNIHTRPILGSIVKPKIGLNPKQYANVCYEFWMGGGDFVKNDEPQADQDFCAFNQMVLEVKRAMQRAVKQTKQKKVHSFNVSSADYSTMIKRCEFIKKAGFEKGSYAFLIDGITAGWMAVQTLRRMYPDVFIHFHRAGHGAYTRKENAFGMSVLVLSKFARLAGASGIHTGTAGIGKMSGSFSEDILSAQAISSDVSMGYFFEQSWLISKSRVIKKSVPIISGGLNPTLLKPFIDTIGHFDFITTMGAGVHAHPDGTRAGARAMVQACDAYLNNISLEVYARTHVELKKSMDFFQNKKKLFSKK